MALLSTQGSRPVLLWGFESGLVFYTILLAECDDQSVEIDSLIMRLVIT
jgi:hypothetical protein